MTILRRCLEVILLKVPTIRAGKKAAVGKFVKEEHIKKTEKWYKKWVPLMLRCDFTPSRWTWISICENVSLNC